MKLWQKMVATHVQRNNDTINRLLEQNKRLSNIRSAADYARLLSLEPGVFNELLKECECDE